MTNMSNMHNRVGATTVLPLNQEGLRTPQRKYPRHIFNAKIGLYIIDERDQQQGADERSPLFLEMPGTFFSCWP